MKSRDRPAKGHSVPVRPGEESGRNLAVSVRIGTQTAFDHKMILVRGADQPSSTVNRISGRIRDAGGRAVRGATLTVQDSAGHDHRTTSTGSGRFSITSSTSRPIAAGPLTVVAVKDGYRTARATVRGAAGGSATVRLTLTAVATPATTAPSPTAAASTPEVAATEESLALAAPPATTRTADDSDSGLLMYTVLGGLLVAAGLGTLVLLVMRRRSGDVHPAPAFDAPTEVLRTVPSYERPDRQRGEGIMRS